MESTVLELNLSGRVCEFGNQRYGGVGGYPTVSQFYLDNGFDSYIALDVNTEKSAVIADLNYPLETSIYGLANWEGFDLVTNNGTSEHLWNQHQVFTNAHNLCKEGGVILHILPFTPWINHGFFNYNPIVFRDLAAANGYEIVIQRMGNRWGETVNFELYSYREKNPAQLQSDIQDLLSLKKGDVFCVFALKKVGDNPFRMPIQGKYAKDIESDELARRYAAK